MPKAVINLQSDDDWPDLDTLPKDFWEPVKHISQSTAGPQECSIHYPGVAPLTPAEVREQILAANPPVVEEEDDVITISSEETESGVKSATFPEVTKLFSEFDFKFFGGHLERYGVVLEWSKRMTLAAGLCYWRQRPTQREVAAASKQWNGVDQLLTKYPKCIIRLSEPLLSLRPVRDLEETLAHEMIHAYCFIFNIDQSRGHGPEFIKLMHTINAYTGMKITVYHSFFDEVRHLRKHVWRCQGSCQHKPPYYGYVQRAINRAPGPASWWWPRHQRECGGTYIKIAGPDLAKAKDKVQRAIGPSERAVDESRVPSKVPEVNSDHNYASPEFHDFSTAPPDFKSLSEGICSPVLSCPAPQKQLAVEGATSVEKSSMKLNLKRRNDIVQVATETSWLESPTKKTKIGDKTVHIGLNDKLKARQGRSTPLQP